MKTIETTFEPSKDGNVAIGAVTLTGTDKEVQAILNKIGELKDTTVSANYILGEYIRVRDERCYEFCEILGVGAGIIEIADKYGKTVAVSMSSVQNMGKRRVLSLVGGRVQKDIVVGDLVVLNDGLSYECNKTTTTYPFASVKGNGEDHMIIISRFESGDKVVLPNGIQHTVYGYSTNGNVITEDDGPQEYYDESELEPWDPVTAVQRYAASFGMKVNVDVS